MNKLILTALVLQMTLTDKLKARRESGQGTLEYVGMVAVACIIIAAVITVIKGVNPDTLLQGFIDKVTTALGKP